MGIESMEPSKTLPSTGTYNRIIKYKDVKIVKCIISRNCYALKILVMYADNRLSGMLFGKNCYGKQASDVSPDSKGPRSRVLSSVLQHDLKQLEMFRRLFVQICRFS
ncbi:hypothetical protein AVEN_35706-1 [Araneus ventricosus]|uniref:Uncharacterized protein n=1 Tax=Araneus ventricosus TaxID=182803 RepID=A0A4Y2HYD1_ARAVE|nr:hypothetical protein AVEN_35706-1 [Araneus ventricosus]